MKKEVSIVLSPESKNYRRLAQKHYGLTDEQMIGMDVHHNPPRHQGGRNIPEHLFIYHETLHSAVHGNDFTRWAREGGKLGAKAQPRDVRVNNGRRHGGNNLRKVMERNPNHQKEASLRAAAVRGHLMRTSKEFRCKFIQGAKKAQETIRERRNDPAYDEWFRRTRGAGGKANGKPIVMTNIDTGEKLHFGSAKEASETLNIHFGSISNAARGVSKRAGRWKVQFQGKDKDEQLSNEP